MRAMTGRNLGIIDRDPEPAALCGDRSIVFG